MEENQFEELSRLNEVYEELGSQEEEVLDDLVVPFRNLVFSSACMLKDGKNWDFAKVHVLSDLILISLEVSKMGKKTRQGKKNKRQGTLDKKTLKGTMEIMSLENFHGSFKLLHLLDLRNCQSKLIGKDPQGLHGLSITHVSRGKEQGKVLTRIAKFELWFSDMNVYNLASDSMIESLAALIEQDDRFAKRQSERSSVSRSGSVTSTGTSESRRKWATNKRATLERNLERTQSSGDARTLSRTGSESSLLQLNDLEKRYNFDLKQSGE